MTDTAWLLPAQEQAAARRQAGFAGKPIVWLGGPYTLYSCPVRELDPDADYYIEWMLATHHQTETGWVMHSLPAAGGVGVQDARLMQGIAWARDEANAFVAEQQRDRQRKHEEDQFFAQIEQEARA